MIFNKLCAGHQQPPITIAPNHRFIAVTGFRKSPPPPYIPFFFQTHRHSLELSQRSFIPMGQEICILHISGKDGYLQMKNMHKPYASHMQTVCKPYANVPVLCTMHDAHYFGKYAYFSDKLRTVFWLCAHSHRMHISAARTFRRYDITLLYTFCTYP